MSDKSDSERESSYDPIWTVAGDADGREVFNRYARQAVAALGWTFASHTEAVDYWLNAVYTYHATRNSRLTREGSCIRNVLDASAEYCAELATNFIETADLEAERKFEDLEPQFRFRPNPSDFGGVRLIHPWDLIYAARHPDVDHAELAATPTIRQGPQAGPIIGAAGAQPRDIEKCKAERRKLLEDYKAECKRCGSHVTYERIANDVNSRWKSRTQIDKWLQCDPRYDEEPDRLIRGFLTRETQRLREMRLKKPHR